MPIYEYKCENCEHTLEELQKFTDKPLILCPNCNTENLKQLISPSGFRIHGGGVYKPTSRFD